MAGGWTDSNRRAELPPNWYTEIRPRILERDSFRCRKITIFGERCTARATDVDHIQDPHDHSDANLQALCGHHHRRKTAQEGNLARRRYSNRRPQERHPGLL